jgi:hypothetical protein
MIKEEEPNVRYWLFRFRSHTLHVAPHRVRHIYYREGYYSFFIDGLEFHKWEKVEL